jgi:hypothetical protein
MKPLLMALVFLISYTAIANSTPSDIAPQAIIEFNKTFKEASHIEWAEFGELSRVKFYYNNEVLYAFYNEEGGQVCMGRTITMHQLPLQLQLKFTKDFIDYTVLDVFEIWNDYGVSYYISSKSNNKKIILRSAGINWMLFSKTRIK